MVQGSSVCLLHLFRSDHTFDFDAPIIAQYERVADRYRILSINIGRIFERAVPSNDIRRLCFDGLHLTVDGARWVAELIANATQELFAAPTCDGAIPPRVHADQYEQAAIEPAQSSILAKPERGQSGRFRLRYSYVTFQSDNEASFQSGGLTDGMLLVVGPDSGFIKVRTDTESTEYLTWDAWCTYERLQAVIFKRPILENTTVRISVLNRSVPDDRSAKTQRSLKIVGFLVRPEPVPKAMHDERLL